ncbi:MAG: hypothetical protein CM15mP121_0730 [Bacteroidota bacterium]|nr:MAG: hypothetical protein CM15mP121_0730 [Bacteroidota bacterium]
MPYSVIESMALSRPSVLTNTDGNRDLVIDKKTGFLVEVGDDLEMANKIITLLNDNKLRNSFALQAKKLLLKIIYCLTTWKNSPYIIKNN